MTTTIPLTAPATAPAAASNIYSTATGRTGAKKEMDQEVFLNLLVAQLRNQDPTAPMDTNAMMAQSTQLASMEQLTGLAETSRESFALQMRIAASGLVGQQISYLDAAGVAQRGLASGVSFETSVPMVTVGESRIPLDAVSAISTRTTTATEPVAPTDAL